MFHFFDLSSSSKWCRFGKKRRTNPGIPGHKVRKDLDSHAALQFCLDKKSLVNP